MKHRYNLLVLAVLFCSGIKAQTFWTENFNNGCSSGCDASAYTGTNGAWTQTITGTEGTDPNMWYVSCAENGHTSGICGTGCAAASSTATLASLHVGSNPNSMGDVGAAYDAGGLCGILTCPETSRRIESPVINCSAINQPIGVSFNYISAGSPPSDLCNLWYYNGSTWTLLQAIPPTINSSCSGQGLWTNITIALPASAIGNANVKIGFEWKNNDDGAGTDPSFAVDDVMLGVTNSITTSPASEAKVIYNSSSDAISVNTGIENASAVTAELYSIDGRLMLSRELTSTQSDLNVAGFAAGTYILHLTAEGKNFLPVKLMID